MEPPPKLPSKITKTYFTLRRKLQEIEAEIIQFIDLPIDASGLDDLAHSISKKLLFFRKLLTTEIATYGSMSQQLLEFEARLRDLEAEFLRRNSDSVIVHENDGSENGSVCESCLNNDRDLQIENESESERSSVYGVPETLFEALEEAVHESIMPVAGKEEDKPVAVDGDQEKTGGRRLWWWRTVVVVMTTVSSVLTVSFWSYFNCNSHGGFVTPT